MVRMRIATLLLFLGCLANAGAGQKPNFTGQWILNLNRSEYGSQQPPKKMTYSIEHKEPTLRITASEVSPLDQEVRYELKYTTEGKETGNELSGTPLRSTAVWDSQQLRVHSWASLSGWSIDLKDTWRLVEDGSTLIVLRHISGTTGAFDETLVFDKK